MNVLKLENANLISAKKDLIKIFNPKVRIRQGHLSIKGVLNFKEPNSKEEVIELEQHLRIRYGAHDIGPDDFLQIVGTGDFGSEVLITNVHCINISYQKLTVEFISYGFLKRRNSYPIQGAVDAMNAIGVLGLSIAFNKATHFESKRSIQGREQNGSSSMRFDYTEQKMIFEFGDKRFNLNLTLLDYGKGLTMIRFEHPNSLDLVTYQEIRQQLRAFLSYPTGNTLHFQEEHFVKEETSYVKVYSGKRLTPKVRSEYVPVANIQFRSKKVLSDYLSCFDTFLYVDKHLDLTGYIFIYNQSRKVALDTSIFVMLIALEKLASNYVESIFFQSGGRTIIDQKEFDKRIALTKNQFKSDFQDLDGFNKLNSKLGSINQNSKTDRKLEALLDFAQIKRTQKIDHLLTTLRNKAIHRGQIDTEGENGYDNFRNLTLLCNRILCNLIQYKGLRLVEKRGETIHVEQKKEFSVDYKNFSSDPQPLT